jgi:hypothetical protein
MKSKSTKQKANKNNAAKSTGPKTEEGKQAVALNGITHGLRSLKPVIPWLEKEEDWLAHRDLIISDLQPANKLENALADRIALGLWRLARSVEIQPRILSAGREKHRYRAIKDFLRSEGLTEYKVSTETTFACLQSQRDHLTAVSAAWGEIIGNAKTPIAGSDVIDEIFDSVCPPEKFSDLEEPFNERFDWPPETASILRSMIDWLMQNMDEEFAIPIENLAEAADARAKEMQQLIERIESAGNRAADLALIQSGDLETMQRYETSIHRTLQKDLHELQRLQAMRSGKPVAAPFAIDLTSDS